MAFDGYFLREIVKELREQLQNKKIEKIYQTGKYEIIIYFSKIKKQYLYINVSADSPRIYMTDEEILKPETPPMFAMLLRKLLVSAVVDDIVQISLERIIRFDLSAKTELGETTKKHLFVEIMGRHSNIILTDENYQVTEAIKTVSPFMSKRPMQKGEIYSSTSLEKKRISAYSKEEFIDIISKSENVEKSIYKSFSGFSPSIAKSEVQFLQEKQSVETVNSLYNSLLNIDNNNSNTCYYYKNSKPELSSVKLKHRENEECEISHDFNKAYRNYYREKSETNLIKRESKSIEDRISEITRKNNNRINNLKQDIKEAEKLETYRVYGELLLANRHLIQKGDKAVKVFNYYDNTEIEIPIKTDKSPSENSDYYYKKYQKAKSTLVISKEQITKAEHENEYLETVKLSLIQAENFDEMREIKRELIQSGYLKDKDKAKKKKREKKLPPREFKSPSGLTVKVGRNNFQNDELTLKSSNKKHLWLHTKVIPSAHVVLCSNREEISEEDLLYAASICAYYSKARESENVPVDYTEIKNVSKPKGAKAGKVIYINYKTIYVNPADGRTL